MKNYFVGFISILNILGERISKFKDNRNYLS